MPSFKIIYWSKIHNSTQIEILIMAMIISVGDGVVMLLLVVVAMVVMVVMMVMVVMVVVVSLV